MTTILTPVFVEKFLGDQAAPEIEPEYGGVLPNAPLTAYLAGIGAKLVAANGRRPSFKHTFKVLGTTQIPNAFAMGNGNVYVTAGILPMIADESELAYLLGHEIGHVGRRHIAHQLDISLGVSALLGIGQSIAYGAAGGSNLTKDDVRRGSDTIFALVTSGYSREMENEADHDGVAAAHDAGYDPWGAVRMMRKFAVLEAGQAEKPLDSFFRSHPYSTDRVKIMSKQIETHYGPEGYFKGDVGADAYQRATNPHYAAGLTAAGQRNVLVAAGVGALAVGAGVLAYSLAHG